MSSPTDAPRREPTPRDVTPRDLRAADITPRTVEPRTIEPSTPIPTDTARTSIGPAGDLDRDDRTEPVVCRDWSNRDDRFEMIAEAAYFRAERRGFRLGDEEVDWLEAERELIDRFEGGRVAPDD